MAVRSGPSSWVRATFTQSCLTLATPKAVFSNIGQIEQIKITKIAEASESWMMNRASGIQAKGEIGRSTWMYGFRALYISGDMPIRKPMGSAMAMAARYPVSTRYTE